MDWKSYYRNELASAAGQAFVQRCFERQAQRDPQIVRILEDQGIISFPHTSIYYAGEGFARLIVTLYRLKIERIIALGVLHGAKLPGAFIQTAPTETPFGTISHHPAQGLDDQVIQRSDELLANEFSLDTFLSLIALHARRQGLQPLSTLPLYVGLTRDAHDSFEAAAEVAQQLRRIVDDRTAIVATGDLVHYGTAYSSAEELAGKPTDPSELKAYFLERMREALGCACRDKDYSRFFEISSAELKNDQRQILPVICEYLGQGVDYEILSFELSDYSRILEAKPPCLVASALVGFAAVKTSPGKHSRI